MAIPERMIERESPTRAPSEEGDDSEVGDVPDVELAANGDARAFERLYRRHVDRVYSLACRMVGSEEADEITQDVFVRTWRKLDTFRGEAAFGSWLYRLAINVIYGRQRARSTRRKRYVGSELALSRAASPRRRVELTMDFDAAIQHLPDGARQIFVLHDVEGYKHREIAEMLEITQGTSKSQLHRARMILREHLDR